MSTAVLLELFAGAVTAFVALWFVVLNRPSPSADRALQLATTAPSQAHSPALRNPTVTSLLKQYLLRKDPLLNVGLLVLRLAIGVMMIHHGQDKLANPQSFADTYVAALHLPFPLVLSYVAGYSELIGSWLLIFGLFTPLGAVAITGTMAVAAYHHILTAGLNIYVLELVVLYLGGSLALLLGGPGRFSFDASMASELIETSAPDPLPVPAEGVYGLSGTPS